MIIVGRAMRMVDQLIGFVYTVFFVGIGVWIAVLNWDIHRIDPQMSQIPGYELSVICIVAGVGFGCIGAFFLPRLRRHRGRLRRPD